MNPHAFRPRRAALALACALAVLPGFAIAEPPDTVLIQGQLLNQQGEPIPGLRQFRVRFFDAESGGAQLGASIIDVTVVNAQGQFAIPVTPPQAALEAPALWYELAIDSAAIPLGVGEDDVFPNRIRVHSVPFARVAGTALEVDVEAIGGGIVNSTEFGALAGVTAGIQTQLDAKADAGSVYTQAEIDAQQSALDAAIADRLPRTGPAYIVVDVTDDPVENGARLLAAYTQAASLTPHGQPLSATNRVAVMLPPGHYDLGTGSLVLDTAFVDIEGVSTSREKQYIFGLSGGPGTGVLRQVADDVRIANLFVHCTRSSGSLTFGASDPAAYFPNGGLSNTIVRNCLFLADDENAWSMRIGVVYSGIYEFSAGGTGAFGGGVAGNASGTFTNCTGETGAFGGGGGTASGVFTNCTGGTGAFGGAAGVASGVFTNCTGDSDSFGGGFGTTTGARLTNCRMTGTWGGNFRGRMENCQWATGIFLGDGARVYASTFTGSVSINAGAGITHSRFQDPFGEANNVFGATNAEAFNLVNLNVQ